MKVTFHFYVNGEKANRLSTEMTFEETMSISEVKDALTSHLGFNAKHLLRLITKGKFLTDSKTLKDYSLQDGDAVSVLFATHTPDQCLRLKRTIYDMSTETTIIPNMVDVTGIDRKELLRALWENAKPSSFFAFNSAMASSFDIDEVMKELEARGYVNYACGRCIKCRIFSEEDVIDPFGYDKEWGKGAFQRVVDTLRK